MNKDLLEAMAQFVGPLDKRSVRATRGPSESASSSPDAQVTSEYEDFDATAVVSSIGKNGNTQQLARRGYTRTHRFVVLPSQSEPRWLLPLGDRQLTREGFRIYTPYAPVARILKNLAATVMEAGWTGWARNHVLVASKKPLPLEVLIGEVTGEREPIFALSLGTPGQMRKLTVQVMRPGGEILGYIKLPLTQAASTRIRHEAAVLERLWSYPALRRHLPRVLHAGEWESGYILFQSRGPSSPGEIEFGPAHVDFLKTLWNVKRTMKPGEVLVRDIAARWRKALPRLGDKWRALGEATLERAGRELAGATIPCGIMHGDFAPWNTRTENGRLFVYDWEASDWEAPNLWDAFHFHLQVESLLNRKGRNGFLAGRPPAERASFWMYLLRSSCQQLDEAAPGSHGMEYRHQILARELL
jgi:hypothetical protein